MGLIEVKKIAYDQQLLGIPCCERGSVTKLNRLVEARSPPKSPPCPPQLIYSISSPTLGSRELEYASLRSAVAHSRGYCKLTSECQVC